MRASFLFLSVLVACGDDSSSPVDSGRDTDFRDAPADVAFDGDAPGDSAVDVSADAAGGGLEAFEITVAEAQCAAIFRCCNDESVTRFFSVYRSIPGLPSPFEALQDRIPPDATLDEASCVSLMQDLNNVAPFGTWLVEARAGRVGFDEAAYAGCLNDLATTSCGRELIDVFNDTSCFAYLDSRGLGDPAVGNVARAMFPRTAGVGDPCVAPEDSSADAYGTCAPETAFCCFRESPADDCGPAGAAPGECVAAGAIGETCNAFPPQPCVPGVRCRAGASIEDPSMCVEAATGALAVGDTCAEAFVPLGVCTDGFCDAGGTDQCVALKANGDACVGGAECTSGNCAGEIGERVCADFDFCAGS
ncbi:MAG: hypothetical protein AAGE52_06695 [Myxococcota bacterium]